jgi:predicted RNase H-like HicB family nuclease
VTDADTRSLDRYTIVIRPDDNGTFVAYLPALPGCHALGRTAAEAQAEPANVFSMVAEDYAEEGRSLPPDVPVLAANAG